MEEKLARARLSESPEGVVEIPSYVDDINGVICDWDDGEDERPTSKEKKSSPTPSPERLLWYDPAFPTLSRLLAPRTEEFRSIVERLEHLERLEHSKAVRLEERLEHFEAANHSKNLQAVSLIKSLMHLHKSALSLMDRPNSIQQLEVVHVKQ